MSSLALRVTVSCLLSLAFGVVPKAGRAQAIKPAAKEIAAIRACATKYRENLDDGERLCLFNLVAEPCTGKSANASEHAATECYRMEGTIWDGLLNENYKALLDALDPDQTAKAQAMQHAWIAYRDTTCQFYDDKIRGSMSIRMHAACITRETARRAMLLKFFSQL